MRTTIRRLVTPIRSARVSTTSSRSSAAKRRSSAGTARTSHGAPGDPPATSLIFSYQGGITIKISAAELGNTKKLKFDVLVFSGITIDPTTGDLDFTNAVGDIAPAAGAGLYQYEVKITPPTLVVRSLKPTPKNPTAGRPFTLKLVAARSDTNAVVQNGRVTCVGRIGNARLRAQVQRVQGGAATCTWNLPPTAKGKTFRGSVAVVFEGLESLAGVFGQGSLGTAACATPGASRFSPRCRRHHRDGFRIARPHAARRHRAGAARRPPGA